METKPYLACCCFSLADTVLTAIRTCDNTWRVQNAVYAKKTVRYLNYVKDFATLNLMPKSFFCRERGISYRNCWSKIRFLSKTLYMPGAFLCKTRYTPVGMTTATRACMHCGLTYAFWVVSPQQIGKTILIIETLFYLQCPVISFPVWSDHVYSCSTLSRPQCYISCFSNLHQHSHMAHK